MDIYDPAMRSRVMSAVKSADTAPEMAVRRLLYSMGHRYRLHRADLPRHPIGWNRFTAPLANDEASQEIRSSPSQARRSRVKRVLPPRRG
jgi:hypothetical protein